MRENFLWMYLLHLSTHMWDDEYGQPRGWYLPKSYTENNDTDLETWDETVKCLAERKFNAVLIDVGDGILYDSHPEISAPDAWSKDFLKKKLDEMRALGMEPIPKLNFSTGHDTWLKGYRRMVSTPQYYTLCADLIREVCEVFGWPRLFHLGFDEEAANFQTRRDLVVVRNAELWWHDLNFLAAECEKHGARPWVWSDYCWHHRELFLKNMSKSILQSNWYYGMFGDGLSAQSATCIETYGLLDEHGYDQIPTCSTWSNKYNTRQTLAHGRAKLSEAHLCGYMTASWMMTTAENRFAMLSDAQRFWYARREIYPETIS